MTQEEKRVWLIRQLLDEDPYYKHHEIPEEEQEQKNMLRALMNVRAPKMISPGFLRVQDEYLTRENLAAGITDVAELSASGLDERLILWQGDITALKVDAIVNAANSQMCGCFRALHNCVDNIIHSKAGIELRLKCNEIMTAQGYEEPTGRAKITPAYNLPCKYVLHTVGPIVQGRVTNEHGRLLSSCYLSCLELAEENHLESIAFCCISTGVFMFPNQRAAEIAVETVRNWLDQTESTMKIVFNVYKDQDLQIYNKILNV
ncbi:MAG: protein-ADP-ribose hydrolase [Blautia sp.]|nr:protein-ADP-ribose hydrolase [Blautia sp.]